MKLRRLSTRASGFDARLAALTRYEAAQDPGVQRTVRAIIEAVRGAAIPRCWPMRDASMACAQNRSRALKSRRQSFVPR
jgi:hypothetical protein